METASYFGALVKMLLALGVVLVLMVGTVYVLKRMMGHTPAGSGEGEAITILAARSLGPKTSILILDTLGKVIVIGIAANSMHVLTTIDDPARLDALRRARERLPLPPSPLWERIKHKMGKP